MSRIDNPDGTLIAAGAGMACPATHPGIAAAPGFRFIRIFLRIFFKKGKK